MLIGDGKSKTKKKLGYHKYMLSPTSIKKDVKKQKENFFKLKNFSTPKFIRKDVGENLRRFNNFATPKVYKKDSSTKNFNNIYLKNAQLMAID